MYFIPLGLLEQSQPVQRSPGLMEGVLILVPAMVAQLRQSLLHKVREPPLGPFLPVVGMHDRRVVEEIPHLARGHLPKVDLRVTEQLARVFALQLLSKNNFGRTTEGRSCRVKVRWTNSRALP